ncbi:Arm DNA-binding domain-containing protein [Chitinophaga sp. YIM B06452]|uniref:Arm DNA-binding domain-containing protein n=1 Tax=Chitinophaga sp. YIM B06452 TaxID=3082158 RepID=UPI0031FE7A3A
MQVKNQKLSILFFHSLKRTNAKGLASIWVRLTIDGMEDEISTSIYVHPDHWDGKSKK